MKTLLTFMSLSCLAMPLVASSQDCGTCKRSFGVNACLIYRANDNSCNPLCNDPSAPWWQTKSEDWWKESPKDPQELCLTDCRNMCHCCDD